MAVGSVSLAPPAVRRFERAARLYDRLQRAWDAPATERVIGGVLVAAYLGALAAIELARRGLLGPALAAQLPHSHFAAVGFAFTLLLFAETLSLVFSIARSVSDAVGKQFELLSVILLRKAFLAFADLREPVAWADAASAVPTVLADMGGALLVFVVTGFFYRVQRHRPITVGEAEEASFVAAKKAVALTLLAAFVVLVAETAVAALGGPAVAAPTVHTFFEQFYTLLIFSDVLLVLVALCYSGSYHVVFRNSGFAAATLVLRLALTAPSYVNAALGVGAALFGVAVSLAYNAYTPAGRIVGTTGEMPAAAVVALEER